MRSNQKGKTVVNRVEEKFCFQGEKTYCAAPFSGRTPALPVCGYL